MEKVFFVEPHKCSKCNKTFKTLFKSEIGLVCKECYLKHSQIKLIKEHPEYLTHPKRNRKLFKFKTYCSKKIYAINGIKTIYNGGCTQ